ncbi:MAG: hypothetical protein MZV70_67275 [Desulfobacterales bacterium]|nr:hypothetical protein [Desulfobacterales bacterium]
MAGASGHVTTIFPEDRGLRLIYGEPRAAAAQGRRDRPGNRALLRGVSGVA